MSEQIEAESGVTSPDLRRRWTELNQLLTEAQEAYYGAAAPTLSDADYDTAMRELEDQMHEYAEGKEITKSVFPHQIAFNVFSHNTKMAENGYNEEENKVVEETRKMFHAPDLPIVPTCIRVPVLRSADGRELDWPFDVAAVVAFIGSPSGP